MSLAAGAASFLAGLGLLRRAGLRRFVWAPMAVAAVVLAPLLFYGYGQAQTLSAWALAALPSWLDWLVAVLWPVAALLALVVASWLLGFVAALVASPWLGMLAAQAERAEFGDAVEVGESVAALIINAWRRELQKLRYHMPRLAALLLLPLVPGFNLVAPFAWLVFGAWLLALQFVDYASENRGLPFAATRALLAEHGAAALGFGSLAALALAIPLAAPVVVPAAVCGGAVLWRRLQPAAAQEAAGTSGRTGQPAAPKARIRAPR